jgi:diguanylate cyclase (GGDEF)-like protein/PAS domain S-box-containing protein
MIGHFLLGFLMLLTLCVAGLLFNIHRNAKEQKELEVRVNVENLGLLLDQTIQSSVEKIDLALRSIVEEVQEEHNLLGKLNRPKLEKLLLERANWLSGLSEFRVTDASGVVKFGPGVTPTSTASYADRPFFIKHKNQPTSSFIVSNPVIGRVNRLWVIVISRRYDLPDGSFGGVVAAAVPVSYFQKIVSAINVGTNGIALMRDADTGLVARHPIDPKRPIGEKSYSQELGVAMASGVLAQTLHAKQTADGSERILSYRNIPSLSYSIVVGAGALDYLKEWKKSVTESVVMGALFLSVAYLFSWLLWRSLGYAQRASQRSQIMLQSSSDGIHILDVQGNFLEVSDSFCKMLGYSKSELIGMNVSQWACDLTIEELWDKVGRDFATRAVTTFETRHRCKDGSIFDVEVTAHALELDGKKVMFNASRDITERKKSENVIWTAANFDHLTKLPNRRLFHDRLEQEIRKAQRYNSMVGLLFLDLDHFKDVNDSLGHNVGDLLLIEAAQRIRNCVRKCDTLARLGGDEFTVILSQLKDASDIGPIAQKIVDRIAQPYMLEGHEVVLSVSIGISIVPDHALNAIDAIKHADQAMYVAKNQGRNCFRIFTKNMQDTIEKRMNLSNDLRHALKLEQFQVHYQPIIELKTGRVTKAEALLRWMHPQHGFISPAVFIPVAEASGAIHDIGDWVFKQACEQVKRLQSMVGEFQISVNSSPVQFGAEASYHTHWVEHLKLMVLQGGSIAVEITEGLMMNPDAKVVERLLTFRDAGIQVAIDDFGTGYSSLSYLKKFDIDYLKIDQSFIKNLTPNSPDLALCEAIVVMAHKLGLKVIAEGVETQTQSELLSAMGCDYAQGHLFCRPVSVDAFEKFLLKS